MAHAHSATFHTFLFLSATLGTAPGFECARRLRSFFSMLPLTVSLTCAAFRIARGRCLCSLIRLICGRCLCCSTSAASYSRLRCCRWLGSVVLALGLRREKEGGERRGWLGAADSPAGRGRPSRGGP